MSVTTPSTRDVRAHLAEMRKRRTEQRRETASLRERAAEDPSHAAATLVVKSRNAEDELTAQIENLEAKERAMLGQIGRGVSGVDVTGPIGEQFADPAFAQSLERLSGGSSRIVDVSLGEIDRETLMGWTGRALAAGFAPTPGMGQAGMAEVVPLQAPPTTFLDLLPSFPLEASSYPFVQRLSGGVKPAPTAPEATKPQIDANYQDAEATPATIAGFIKVPRQSLADVVGLAAEVQTDLVRETRTALETELMSGTGAVSDRTGKPGIVGLLNTTGVAAVAQQTGEQVADALLDAIVDALVIGARPNVIAMNPTDWATLLKSKSSGSGEYVANPFLATAQQVWGTALVPATGVPAKQVIVGDTTLGARLLWREPAAIYMSNNDQDDFVRNRVTILCECRAAFAVRVPGAFCVVTLL